MLHFTLTEKERAAFAAVSASAEPPGTIVHDFDALLDFLAAEGIPVSPKTFEFAIARLPELNALLAKPMQTGLSRGRQVSYPHLDGLHGLLLSNHLGKLDRSRSTPRIVLNAGRASSWRKLIPIERYLTLLETWWSFAESDMARPSLWPHQMAEYRFELLKTNAPAGRRKRFDPEQQKALLHLLGMKQVALMQMFGMIEIEEGLPTPGKGWNIQGMTATPWGMAACGSYHRSFGEGITDKLDRLLGLAKPAPTHEHEEDEQPRPPFHCWGDVASPFFPQWQHSIGDPEEPESFGGSLILKVSHGKDIWRRVVLPGGSSFDELASLILHAFNFDADHLYQFTFHDDYAKKHTLNDSYSAEELENYAADVALGDVGLFAGQVIEFRYDFGDDWRFEVLVEKLDEATTGAKPAIVAKQGKSPRQYDW